MSPGDCGGHGPGMFRAVRQSKWCGSKNSFMSRVKGTAAAPPFSARCQWYVFQYFRSYFDYQIAPIKRSRGIVVGTEGNRTRSLYLLCSMSVGLTLTIRKKVKFSIMTRTEKGSTYFCMYRSKPNKMACYLEFKERN